VDRPPGGRTARNHPELGGPAQFLITTNDEIRARVTDSGSWKTPAANPGNSGRGLMLMRALSETMELDSTPTGTTVDVTFRRPAEAG